MWTGDLLPPSDFCALDEVFRTRLPCVFDIAVFCMSIYQWVFFFPKLLKAEWLGRVVKRLDVSICS